MAQVVNREKERSIFMLECRIVSDQALHQDLEERVLVRLLEG